MTLERCRNGRPGEWLLEFDHAAHRFSLAAALADPARVSPRRRARLSQIDPRLPLVLAVEASGGPRIAAVNAAAEDCGLMAGDLLADARAKADALQVAALDRAADAAALRRLALWATRYTPAVSPWGEQNGADGFFLDVTGAAHLFGGEEMLLADLSVRLNRFGLPARLAVAETPGVAWALSHFHASDAVVLPADREAAALAPLPIAALRVAPETRHHAAAARLQARRRPDRPAARTARGALRGRAAQAPRPGDGHRGRAAALSSCRRRSITACATWWSRS